MKACFATIVIASWKFPVTTAEMAGVAASTHFLMVRIRVRVMFRVYGVLDYYDR